MSKKKCGKNCEHCIAMGNVSKKIKVSKPVKKTGGQE